MKARHAILEIKNEKNILIELDAYAEEHGLSRSQLAEKLSVPYNTLIKWSRKSRSARKPSATNIEKIKILLEGVEKPEITEARHRTEKVKYLLLLLEDELRWFRDNSPDAREMFRRELNPFDIGYISSLLSMLTEEDKFNRWLALTTARFNFFKRG